MHSDHQQEAEMIAYLERATGETLDRSDAGRALPYVGYGKKRRADAIWQSPHGSALKGICIEIQGMGSHSRITGMANDCHKCAQAQVNGWLWFAITYKKDDMAAMAGRLRQMMNMFMADMPDTPQFDPMEDAF